MNRANERGLRGVSILGALASTGGMLLLLLLAPVGGAVTPHFTKTAPYTGSVLNSNTWSVAGCARAKITSPAAFSLTSGSGGFAGWASAKSCRHTSGGFQTSSSAVYGSSSVSVKLKVATSGSKAIWANWTFTATGHQNLSKLTCAFTNVTYTACDEFALVSVLAVVSLEDLNTGATNYSSTYFYLDNSSSSYAYCYQSNCSSATSGSSPGGFSGPSTRVFGILANMNSAHSYALTTYIYETVYVSLSTYYAHFVGGASGSASLDMATGGNGAVLNSVRVA